MRRVTVINVRSLSYTGTTWVNLLLGSHPDAFVLGPPNRVLDKLAAPDGDSLPLCLVHGEQCPFWTDFSASYQPKKNFYLQLAAAARRRVIVINNAFPGTRAASDLESPKVVPRELAIVRDGRAIVASYLRYFPEAELLDAVREWFLPNARLLPYDPDCRDCPGFRYEDIAADVGAFLARVGPHVGLDYPPDASRYWEYTHHIASGNFGPIGMLRRHGGECFAGADAERLERRYQAVLAEPNVAPLDERWRSELVGRDRLVFDLIAGAQNEAWGYERDHFVASEVLSVARTLTADESSEIKHEVPHAASVAVETERTEQPAPPAPPALMRALQIIAAGLPQHYIARRLLLAGIVFAAGFGVGTIV